eukprot:CAMPEP_0197185742 /NCGR_PEP_ID=MMETSP1423-20130617/12596_1 /TAXON_ID=476441 /ORGANISM="Pseudo-nitzschia heimii, Strain UNC1101" /LENGTH=475 /DNA_ID=CAMNT_0042636887 /DNA_START=418 /DNA_END=1845 /DNA_ORIENTATION=+
MAMLISPSIRPSSHYFEAEAFALSNTYLPPFPTSTSKPVHPPQVLAAPLFSSLEEDQNAAIEGSEAATDLAHVDAELPPAVVRAPLKFIGPYPCLALKFPNLATESQRSRNQTGISLDFVLDTAANINTLQGQVAQELKLELLEDSPALPGVSSAGPIEGGETYVLGDSELEQAVVVGGGDGDHETDPDRPNEPFEFMQDLTAAVIPVVNPGSAGLLGLAFFYCFEGGVEFRWGPAPSVQMQNPQDNDQRLVDGMVVSPTLNDESTPSVTFYGRDDASMQVVLSDLRRIPIDPIPLTQLPAVKIRVNGVEMDALLDTGSPVTVLNQRAAEAAGVKTTKEAMEAEASATESGKAEGWNPFASVMDKFQEAQATAQAASRGDILMIGGVDGKPTTLYRSISSDTGISLVGGSDGEEVSLVGSDSSNNNNQIYVGDIPGLAALNGIGVNAPPAVVLGLDVLRQRPKMVFRPRENALYL